MFSLIIILPKKLTESTKPVDAETGKSTPLNADDTAKKTADEAAAPRDSTEAAFNVRESLEQKDETSPADSRSSENSGSDFEIVTEQEIVAGDEEKETPEMEENEDDKSVSSGNETPVREVAVQDDEEEEKIPEAKKEVENTSSSLEVEKTPEKEVENMPSSLDKPEVEETPEKEVENTSISLDKPEAEAAPPQPEEKSEESETKAPDEPSPFPATDSPKKKEEPKQSSTATVDDDSREPPPLFDDDDDDDQDRWEISLSYLVCLFVEVVIVVVAESVAFELLSENSKWKKHYIYTQSAYKIKSFGFLGFVLV